jgi:hypothetical protein
MIGLDVGLWSGFKRKMEIAESFAQPIVVVRTTKYSLLKASFLLSLRLWAILIYIVCKLTEVRCFAEPAPLLPLQNIRF